MSLMRPYKDLNTEISKLSDEYTGVVEDNDDPKGLQRIKVRIKELHGNLETASLPWCVKDNSASTSNSTGVVCIPSVGQLVRVKFDNGDIYSPRYSTGLINTAVPEYLQGGVGFFDFNNFIKISPEGIRYKDNNNNEVIMNSSGITLLDKNKNSVFLDNSGALNINIGQTIFRMDSTGVHINSPLAVDVTAPNTHINGSFGVSTGASGVVYCGNQVLTFTNGILTNIS